MDVGKQDVNYLTIRDFYPEVFFAPMKTKWINKSGKQAYFWTLYNSISIP